MTEEAKQKSRVNYYLALDIMPGATHNEILHAYNRAKNTYSNGSLASYSIMEDESNGSILEEIERAFAVLGNPSKRREYDMDMGYNSWVDENSTPRTDNSRASITSQVRPTIASRVPSSNEVLPDDDSDAVLKTPALSSSPSVIPIRQPSAPAAVRQVFGGEFEPNTEFEKKIAETTEADGAFFKAVRIYRCYTPEALALRCKLSTSHVLTIENEDAASLPAPVYLRGHVFLIAQSLDLPHAERLAKSYVDRMLSSGKMHRKTF